jgi:outer membrane protein OmpA-like peptidoglycan-associated protein
LSRKQIAEENYQVPGWIVTFSDMTTNLLTFFVLLVSMGHIRDDTLFDQYDAEGFMHMIKKGFGFKPEQNFGYEGIKYYIKENDKESPGRTIDAREENIRRVFKEITKSMTAMPSQIDAQKARFLVTSIGFPQAKAQLSEPAKKFLTQFAMNLPQTTGSEATNLYVLGLASDAKTEKEQWILSARRAQAAADFLKNILPSKHHHSVYSWGAGPGGCWVDENSPVSRQSQILIAVLSKTN